MTDQTAMLDQQQPKITMYKIHKLTCWGNAGSFKITDEPLLGSYVSVSLQLRPLISPFQA